MIVSNFIRIDAEQRSEEAMAVDSGAGTALEKIFNWKYNFYLVGVEGIRITILIGYSINSSH